MAAITEGVLREELATQEEELANARESFAATKQALKHFEKQIFAYEQMRDFTYHLLKKLATDEPGPIPEEESQIEARPPAGAEADAAAMGAIEGADNDA